jgi:hypothetical protein
VTRLRNQTSTRPNEKARKGRRKKKAMGDVDRIIPPRPK